MSTRERSSHRSHIAGPIILKIVCLKTPFASKGAHRYRTHTPFLLILFSFYPNKFPIQSGSGLTGTTCETELASREKKKNTFTVSFVASCNLLSTQLGNLLKERDLVCSTVAVFRLKCCCTQTSRWYWDGEWQLSAGIRLTQISSQEITGAGGLPLFTAWWLYPYIDHRLDQSQNTYHTADLAHHFNEEQMEHRGWTFLAPLWTHWYNDCI